jgi:succinate dehydrogenase / fumarate reductase cytochrome b subunit
MKLQPRPLTSSLGSKYLMAITGLALTGFVIAHMAGNLLIYAGPDALNSYAQNLKTHPSLLWTARLGLLAVFVVHLVVAIRLRLANRQARPVRYQYEQTLQASWASRHMMLTGLVLLTFIVYHLAHYTFGVVNKSEIQVTENGKAERLADKGVESPRSYLGLAEVRSMGKREYVPAPRIDLTSEAELESLKKRDPDAEVRHDVYSMVVAGFRNPIVSITYIIAMFFLALHLWHGGSSWLQSLGLNSPHYAKVTGALGPFLAVVLFAGNCSIPIYVMLHF